MAISGDVGSVATLWRFPVKSMAGEQLQDVEVTERGVLGDRAYALHSERFIARHFCHESLLQPI